MTLPNNTTAKIYITRISITLSIALLVGVTCYWYQTTHNRAGGDLSWPLCTASELIQGYAPYACSAGSNMPTNMLPTALLVFPLIIVQPALAASIMIALSTALLVWGLIRDGKYWRLLILLSYPFWQCVQVANWTILLVAIGLTPSLYPLLVVKPHAALPIALTRFSQRGALMATLIIIITFLILPDWPFRWWETAQMYSGGPLIFLFPPALLTLLVLLRWRQEAARYLLFCAITPLRPFYDYFLLFVIPQTPRQVEILVVCSWVGYYCWFFWPGVGGATYMFVWLYIPCLLWILQGKIQTITSTYQKSPGDIFTQIAQWYDQILKRYQSNSVSKKTL